MRLPRFPVARLSTIAAAGVIAVSALIAPALVPEDRGGRIAQALEVDIDLFRRELSPYGDWFQHDRYGEVWRPRGVRRDWRPYYDDGRWAYSDDYGWMWVSDEPWGWAPFHYGRWAYARDDGWIWVPGRQWGPAWVSFRSGPESIGWAPLPPEADWDPDYGFLDDDDDYYDDYYDDDYRDSYDGGGFGLAGLIWSFVRPEGFLEPNFHRYAYDRRDYPRIIHRTRNVTNITVIDNRVVNRSIEINNIERVTRKKVRRVRVEEADRPDRARKRGESIVVYKPVVVEKEGKRWRSRGGDGFRADEEPRKRTKKRGSDDADTARQRQLEPSRDSDVATEQQPRKKKRRDSDSVRQQQVAPSTDADVATEQQPRKKKRRDSDSAGQQQVAPTMDKDVATEQPRKKKKRKAQDLEQQIEPSAGAVGDVEQPVKKKKKRSAASQGNAQPDDDGTSVRKKKKRGSDAEVVRQQQQEDEQPRRKKGKKCKGEGCPDNN
jgi:hypothetical protein